VTVNVWLPENIYAHPKGGQWKLKWRRGEEVQMMTLSLGRV